MPYFSIILPTYNRAYLLPKAIESVLQQTYSDWELIIVDDGSTDNTNELVASYNDKRIRYIYQKNQERSAARNNGINKALGKYICFLDSDDYFLKEKLKNFHDFIENCKTNVTVIYDEISIEQNGSISKIQSNDQAKYDSIFEFLMFNSLYSQQMCIANEVLQKHQYNCHITNNEDTELWLRVCEENKFINLSESNQTVIVEHANRSINLLNDTQIYDILKLYKFIFDKANLNIKGLRSSKNKIYGKLYFNIAKIKMQQSKKYQSCIWLLKSLFSYPQSELNKHIIYCLFNLVIGKVPKQYQQIK